MNNVIFTTLLPVVVVLLLGYFAGFKREFTDINAKVLTRLVMHYALPLGIFCGMVGIQRDIFFSKLPLLGGLFAGMVVGYIVVFVLSHFLFRLPIAISGLIALAISGPAVPFVGVTVLGRMYGPMSSIPVSIASFLMNLFQVPVTIMLLSWNDREVREDSNLWQRLFHTWKQLSLRAIKEPVVFIPLAALAIVLFNLKVPEALLASLGLLGKTTGGVALFASGIILYHRKVSFDRFVGFMVFCKNLLMPVLVGLAMYWLKIDHSDLKEIIITVSIPTASVVAIFAIDYNVAPKEMASVLFFSTVLSVLTMGFFMAALPY